jgi:hypothetical protein
VVHGPPAYRWSDHKAQQAHPVRKEYKVSLVHKEPPVLQGHKDPLD